MPDSGELGRSSEMTEDSRWCREAREFSELAESFSPETNLLSGSLVFRLSDLCLEREKKDDMSGWLLEQAEMGDK